MPRNLLDHNATNFFPGQHPLFCQWLCRSAPNVGRSESGFPCLPPRRRSLYISAPAPVRPRLLSRPVSDAQREAARRNGRRSRGPATERGKPHSSTNARTHGLYAKVHVLSAEDLARFQEKKRAYLLSCSPHSPVEQALLARLAFAATRLESFVATETALCNDALRRTPPGPHHLAQAFESIAESRLLAVLSRLEQRYSAESARLARDIGRERTLKLVDSSSDHHPKPNPATRHLLG